MLVLTRKNRESVVIGRPGELEIALEITVLEIEGGRVRLGFQADHKLPIHRREVWDRICNGNGESHGDGHTAALMGDGRGGGLQGDGRGPAMGDGRSSALETGRGGSATPPLAAALARLEMRRQTGG